MKEKVEMTPTHIHRAQMKRATEEIFKLNDKSDALKNCLMQIINEIELFYGQGKYNGDMRTLFNKAKLLFNN